VSYNVAIACVSAWPMLVLARRRFARMIATYAVCRKRLAFYQAHAVTQVKQWDVPRAVAA